VRFFEEHGHVALPSLPLIPRDDPSVLFVIAGMQQMIPFFLGQATPPSKRLVSIQKCLRVVDIEEVGDDPSHLTYFEMLGNFSVGDYFVPEALRFSWEYLTETLKLEPKRLRATIYPGDELARSTWLEIGMPEKWIYEDPENWWARPGLAGPAGPDSEIHYDRGKQYGCGEEDCGPLCDRCSRYVEIWNNVFMDSFVDEQGVVQRPLASKNIDTGEGFERLLMAVQDVESVYETDVFSPIIQRVSQVIGKPYRIDRVADISMRIIADHSRAITMAIADGAVPGNEGRGYVLRRLLRRSVLRARMLGIERPFLHEPVETVIELMTPHYPEVGRRREIIMRTVTQEEERFDETLARGLPMVERLMAEAKDSGGVVPGDRAFLLHDTYGLPFEMIQEIAAEQDLKVDHQGFQQALEEQKVRGRMGRPAAAGGQHLENLVTLAERLEPTVFTGYSQMETEARIEGLITEGRLVATATMGDEVEIVLDRTPFYAEAGGQVGDTGEITAVVGRVEVSDTQRPYGGIIVHRGRVVEGSISNGEEVTARVDAVRRRRIMPHHSATHLLHLALHETLGPEATQAGSLVAPDRLRFDFRWSNPLSKEQLQRIQSRINELVFADEPVVTRELRYAEAMTEGAMALFGEKYGDLVRVVAMGPSKELCGGTHVAETLEIGPVIITSESGIGSGVRRIEALAGQAAYQRFVESERLLEEAAAALGTSPQRVAERATEITAELKQAERRLSRLSSQVLAGRAAELSSRAGNLDGVDHPGRLLVERVAVDSAEDLRVLTARTLQSLGTGVVVMGSVVEGKPQFAAAVSKDLTGQGYSARAIAQRVGKAVGGGAGGGADFAQGGGRDASKLDEGLTEAERLARSTH